MNKPLLKVVFLLACGFAALSNAQSPPPISAYVDKAAIAEGKLVLSPSGNHVALVVQADKHDMLAVLDRATLKPVAKLGLEKNQYIHSYTWVSHNLIIFSTAEKIPGKDEPGWYGELHSLDIEKNSSEYLFGYRAEGGGSTGSNIKRKLATHGSAYLLEDRLDENGSILIGIYYWDSGPSGRMQLARLNTKTASFKPINAAIPVRNITGTLIDSDRKLRAVSGETVAADGIGTISQLWWRSPETDQWSLVVDESRDRRIVYPLARKGAAQEFYVNVAESGRPDYLALLNPLNGALKPVYQPKTANIGGLLIKADRSDAFAVEDFDGSGRGGYTFLDSSAIESKTMKALAAKFPGEITEITGFSDDGRFASVRVRGDVNPGEYYIHDSVAGTLSPPIKVRPSINPNDAAVVEPLVFKANDGLAVHAWLTMPNQVSGKAPLIVMPHGGPYGVVDRWEFNHEAQLFASRGYAVLQVNFRGSGGYGQDFLNAGVGEWGGKMISDIADGVGAALAKYPLDSSKICIYGISYGGYAAMMGAIRRPDLYRCAVGYSGVYDLVSITKTGDSDDTQWSKAYFRGVLGDDPVWRNANSPTKHAGAIKAKVLLIHGGEDRRTPPEQAETLRRALTAAGNPPDWLYKPMEGHGFYDSANNIEAYTRILEFFDKHIGLQK